jgi:hypothetical protein
MAVFMALVFAASAVVVMSADDSDGVKTGWCGDGVQYEIDGDTLILFGSGATYNWNTSPFYNNDTIKVVIIGEGVTYLGNYLFQSCDGFTYISIPESVTSISNTAFYNGKYSFYDTDNNALSVTAPSLAGHAYKSVGSKNLVRVDNFSGTCGDGLSYSLDSYGTLMITGKGAMKDYVKYGAPWYPYGDIKSIIVGSGVTRIGNNAFYDCDTITSVTVNGATAIGDGAFSGCGAIKIVSFKGACPSIGSNAFYDCDSLRTLSLPDSVVYIGSNAFYDCDSLKSAAAGNGGAAVWDQAFYDCDALSTFTIGGQRR